MQLRLCVIAHTGPTEHRGHTATNKALKYCFAWTTQNVYDFIRGCIHCLSTQGGGCMPGPFDPFLLGRSPLTFFSSITSNLGRAASVPSMSSCFVTITADTAGFRFPGQHRRECCQGNHRLVRGVWGPRRGHVRWSDAIPERDDASDKQGPARPKSLYVAVLPVVERRDRALRQGSLPCSARSELRTADGLGRMVRHPPVTPKIDKQCAIRSA